MCSRMRVNLIPDATKSVVLPVVVGDVIPRTPAPLPLGEGGPLETEGRS